ncbi:MAG: DUF131 domain-containing protein [Methanimicrococcus sp.]|nr:DUF131 domain-containing protein [Methanimicrococcus sp.]
MADISFYFFWQGLVISIILSVLLTIGMTLWSRRKSAGGGAYGFEDGSRHDFYERNRKETVYDSEENERNEGNERDEKNERGEGNKGKAEPRSKTSGLIMIGPIPIVFGSGGVRFDKSAFKYALLFFIIVILIWQIMVRIARL